MILIYRVFATLITLLNLKRCLIISKMIIKLPNATVYLIKQMLTKATNEDFVKVKKLFWKLP